MRKVIALARSRASFLTSWSSLRNCRVSSALDMIFSAISLLRLKKCRSSSRTLLADLGFAEFVFGLRFEDGVFEANRDGADHGFADIVAFVFGVAVFVDGFEE